MFIVKFGFILLQSVEEGSLEEHCHSNGLLGIEEVGSQILIWLGVRLV